MRPAEKMGGGTGGHHNGHSYIRDRVKELRRVKASTLVENPKNWRRHPRAQVEALRGILSEIGYADVLIARELFDGRLMLIDGHLRAQVTPDIEVPVLVLDLDENEADKLLMVLDPLSAMAESDLERIKQLLGAVQTSNPALEELLRSTAGENVWRAVHSQTEPPALIDQAGELQQKWGTKPDQLWKIGDHRLLCGDATKAEDVERVMNGERAVLFATDPPYAVNYTGDLHPQSWGKRKAPPRNRNRAHQEVEACRADIDDDEKAAVELYRKFIKLALKQAITSNAPWYFWHASKRQAMVEGVWAEFGAFVHQQIIWVKSRAVLTHSVYLWAHEPCLFGWIRGGKPRIRRAQVGQGADGFPSTVWEIPSAEVETNAHPTSKPCRLFGLPMAMHTEPGDICYEPFCGSGSQLIAAQQARRRCYAIEKSPLFVAVALERMRQLALKPELVA